MTTQKGENEGPVSVIEIFLQHLGQFRALNWGKKSAPILGVDGALRYGARTASS